MLWLQNKHKVGFSSRSSTGFTLDEWIAKIQEPVTEIISLVEGAGAKNIVENVKEVVTEDGRTISDHVRNIDFDPEIGPGIRLHPRPPNSPGRMCTFPPATGAGAQRRSSHI